MTDILLISTNQPLSANILRTASGINQPLSISYIASYVRQYGYTVKIIDNDIECLTETELRKRIIEIDPMIVGITVNTSSTNIVIDLARLVKSINRNIYLILGGIQPTYLPEIFLKYDEIDLCVRGEGEITTKEIIDAKKNNKTLEDIDGIVYKKDGKFVYTRERELINNLDDLPFPAYDLLPMNRYTLPASRRFTGYNISSIITSRGCPYKCKFCSHNTSMKGEIRLRSVENIIGEMKYLRKEFGVREFIFWDDSILIDNKRAYELFKRIKGELPDIIYTCSSSVKHLTNDMAKIMYESGCKMILFGAESGSEKILKSVNKGTSRDMILRAIEICRKNRIQSFCSFIIGTPDETYETLNETEEFVLNLNPDFAIFTIFTPLPGSEYFDEFIKKGLIDINKTNWDDYINLLSSKPPALTIEFNLKKEELVKYQKKLFMKFYFRPSYIFKRIKTINNWQMLYQNFRGFLAIVKLWAQKFNFDKN